MPELWRLMRRCVCDAFLCLSCYSFFFNETATTEIYTLSLHDALPIWDSYVHITGTPEPEHGKEPSAEINIVSPDYFRVLGMSILRGRAFGPPDTYNGPRGTQSRDGFAGITRARLADVTFLRKFVPGKDPIGRGSDDNQSPKE